MHCQGRARSHWIQVVLSSAVSSSPEIARSTVGEPQLLARRYRAACSTPAASTADGAMAADREPTPLGAHQRKNAAPPEDEDQTPAEERAPDEEEFGAPAASSPDLLSSSSPRAASSSSSVSGDIAPPLPLSPRRRSRRSRRVVRVSALRREPPSPLKILCLFLGAYASHACRIAYVPWVFLLAGLFGVALRRLDDIVERMDRQTHAWTVEAEEREERKQMQAAREAAAASAQGRFAPNGDSGR